MKKLNNGDWDPGKLTLFPLLIQLRGQLKSKARPPGTTKIKKFVAKEPNILRENIIPVIFVSDGKKSERLAYRLPLKYIELQTPGCIPGKNNAIKRSTNGEWNKMMHKLM